MRKIKSNLSGVGRRDLENDFRRTTEEIDQLNNKVEQLEDDKDLLEQKIKKLEKTIEQGELQWANFRKDHLETEKELSDTHELQVAYKLVLENQIKKGNSPKTYKPRSQNGTNYLSSN